jgi:hypothetical protein
LKDLDTIGFVTTERKSVEGERGYRVFTSITERGKRLFYDFENEVSFLPQDLDVEIREEIINLIDRFNKATNDNTKIIIMEKLDVKISNLNRATHYKWGDEVEIKEFYNSLLEKSNVLNEQIKYNTFYFLRYAIKIGYYDEEMVSILSELISDKKNIENEDAYIKLVNNVIIILLRLLAYKPEYKDEPYSSLVKILKQIRFEPESKIYAFNNERETIKKFSDDTRKPLINILFEISNSNTTNQPQPLIDWLLKEL